MNHLGGFFSMKSCELLPSEETLFLTVLSRLVLDSLKHGMRIECVGGIERANWLHACLPVEALRVPD
jgi:hypothetical protein